MGSPRQASAPSSPCNGSTHTVTYYWTLETITSSTLTPLTSIPTSLCEIDNLLLLNTKHDYTSSGNVWKDFAYTTDNKYSRYYRFLLVRLRQLLSGATFDTQLQQENVAIMTYQIDFQAALLPSFAIYLELHIWSRVLENPQLAKTTNHVL